MAGFFFKLNVKFCSNISTSIELEIKISYVLESTFILVKNWITKMSKKNSINLQITEFDFKKQKQKKINFDTNALLHNIIWLRLFI